jgi:hypothetical protein
MKQLVLGLLFTSLYACSTDIEGVWLIQFDYPVATTDGSATCGMEATEWNFIDATPLHGFAMPESLWTTEDYYDMSDSVSFVQISRSDAGSFLVWNDVVYPATSDNGSSLTFEWTKSVDFGNTNSHFIGYTCGSTSTVSYTTTFQVFFEGDNVTGTLSLTDDIVNTYEESDLWTDDESDVAYNCGTPSSTYLESIEPLNGTSATDDTVLIYAPITNEQTETDCGGITCTLTVEEHCSGSYNFTGFNTGLENEAAFESIDGAGQSFGTGF